jgi:hypothetical protein
MIELGVQELARHQMHTGCDQELFPIARGKPDRSTYDRTLVRRKAQILPPVEDFTDRGFRLIGGRLDYLENNSPIFRELVMYSPSLQ